MLPFWHLGNHFGTLGEPCEAIGAAERPPWGPGSFTYFKWIWGLHFGTVLALWSKVDVFVHACFQVVSIQIFCFESEHMELGKQACGGMRGLARTNFSQKLGSAS